VPGFIAVAPDRVADSARYVATHPAPLAVWTHCEGHMKLKYLPTESKDIALPLTFSVWAIEATVNDFFS
jgi:hypothetical protein